MKKLFLAASGLFSAVPGLTIIWKGIGTPPGYAVLFGGIIEAFGALSLVILMVNKAKLKRLSSRKATKFAIALSISCFLSLIIYLFLFNLCVVDHPTHGTVYYPVWSSGHLSELIQRTGSRYAALDRYGSYPLTKAIQQMPGHPFPLIVTTALLLSVYQAIFTTLATAFGILGFHKGKSL